MTDTARIVLLNGAGSSGKSSIAKSLQQIADDPFLHMEMDNFLAMLPEKTFGHPDGLTHEALEEDGQPAVAVRNGRVAQRTLRGMRRGMAAMAAEGNDLIVDEVLLDGARSAADYAKVMAPFRLYWVGVHAPLDVLERRERERGNRELGLARWQFGRVHEGIDYDLELDTSRGTPMECARAIKERFGL